MPGPLTARDLPAVYAAEMWDQNRDRWGLAGRRCRPYYELKLCVPQERPMLRSRYMSALAKHNAAAVSYVAGGAADWNAGFDLFVPETHVVAAGETISLDHHVQAAMSRVEPWDGSIRTNISEGRLVLDPEGGTTPVSYCLYSRSSTALKTPLRLANCVGIIDSGYRGNIVSILDHVKPERGQYTAEEGQRLVQICPPELTAPIYVRLYDDIAELGRTHRGKDGLGSSGS
jgi:hypothetical protein